MDPLYVRLTRSCAAFSTGEEVRCVRPDRLENNIYWFCFWGREIDNLIWNYFLLIPLILDQSPLPTMKKFFSHYFSSSGYSLADDNPSSDRGGGEACFRQLPSAEETYQYRQVQPTPGKGCKKDLYSCDHRSVHVTGWCYMMEKEGTKRVG